MSDTISIKIKLEDAAKFAAETKVATIEVDGLGEAIARANRKSKETSGGVNELKKSLKGLQSLLKPALIIGGIGLFAQLLTTASAGSIGLVAALAPLAGIVLALPAAFLGAAQGLGILKLGLNGVARALGGLTGHIDPKKFAALSPPAQEFVLTLNRMKAPILELQRRVQEGLFPGLTRGLSAAAPALHTLMGPLSATGRVFGGIGEQLGRLVGSRGFLTDLRQQARFNNVELGRLGGAGIHMVDVFRNLMVAARPLVNWLVKLAGGWAASADKATTAGRANGKLAHMFKTIQHATEGVFSIIGNLGRAIFNIGNLGRKHLGESLLASLVKGAQSLRQWTESGRGIGKITKFFEEARPVVYAFAGLLATATKSLLQLGTGGSGGLAVFFKQLRTEVLPEMVTLSKGLIAIFSFIDRNIPGGSWLLTIGYLLSKLNIAGPLAKALYGAAIKPVLVRAGAFLAAWFAGSFETAALAAMYAGDWLKSIAGGPMLAAFAGAGTALGTAFAAALGVAAIAATVIIAMKIGHILRGAEHTETFNANTGKRMSKGETQSFLANEGRLAGLAGPALEREERLHPAWFPGNRQSPQASHSLVIGGHRVPGAAMGGLLTRGGLIEVGERGPELVHLPAGAQVIPALTAPAVATVTRNGGATGWEPAPIHVHVHQKTYLDSKTIAEGTAEAVARHEALV